MINLLLIIILYSIKSKFKLILSGLTIFIAALMVIDTIDPCNLEQDRANLRDGLWSVLDKVSTVGSILSFLPKDGIVILDASCSSKNYIFGGGPGALYRKIVNNELSNYDWYSTIGIFSDIIDGKSETTEGPSTLQVQMISDYGIVGFSLFLIFSFLYSPIVLVLQEGHTIPVFLDLNTL